MKKSTGVILVIIIVLLMGIIGVGVFFLVKGNNDLCKEMGELKKEVSDLSSKYVENTTTQLTNNIENNTNTDKQSNSTIKTYNDIEGTYESQKINVNEGTTFAPYYMNYTLILSKEGTFAYYDTDTEAHQVGYYIIDNNKLTLNSVVQTANDPSASLSNEIIEFTLSNDGTIKGEKNTNFTKKSETPREDTNITKVIDNYMSGCTTSGKDGQGPWFSGSTK